MNKIETFEQFIATTKGNIGLTDFLINILIAAVLAFILGLIYVKFGKSLSNRKQFASNFIIITLTTMIIITIVKSSLALSLGLVGALSIVRFRTAIKEPEELAYMFLCIAIGLGMGASQTQITVTGFLFVSAVIVLKSLAGLRKKDGNFYLNIHTAGDSFEMEELTAILSKYCRNAGLRRIDQDSDGVSIVILAEFAGAGNIDKLRKEISEKYGDGLKLSIFENTGLV